MKNFTLLLLLLLYLPGHFIYAQHQHHQESEDNTAQEHREQNSSTGSPMSHAFSLSLPMTRNGPGTGWLPDASPMYGYMVHGKQWMHMFHGNVFIRYNSRILPAKGCSVRRRLSFAVSNRGNFPGRAVSRQAASAQPFFRIVLGI